MFTIDSSVNTVKDRPASGPKACVSIVSIRYTYTTKPLHVGSFWPLSTICGYNFIFALL